MDEKRAKLSSGTYLLLFVVITLGVSAGTLLAHAIELKLAGMVIAEAVQEISTTQERHAQAAQAELAARKLADQQARATSRTGRELHRLCQEWQASHSVNNTYTTQQGMERHCARYKSYVETGTALPR